MNPADTEGTRVKALVADPNATSRSILAAQLREFGVDQVIQVGRVSDARRALEVRRFDVVMCEQYFTGEGTTGPELLDDLRNAQLLPYATVVIMITGEASYDRVAEAAEAALDSYLLKPHTAAALGERLEQARERKRHLGAIFSAIEAQEFDQAARLCLQRFQQRGKYWLYAARIGAELLLRLNRHDAARKLYDAVIAAQAVPWARLGIARAEVASGEPAAALSTLDALITSQPGYADAYDVMGRVQVDQGQLEQALLTFRQACELTPHSIGRLQKQGMLAYYMGQHEEAGRALDRAATLGLKSKMFDEQSLVLLAFVRFRERDSKALLRCRDTLARAHERKGSTRLARFHALVEVLALMLQKQLAAALDATRALAGDIDREDFDVESACNVLSLLAELSAAELQLDEIDSWVDSVAMRFSTTRGIGELLARAAGAHAAFVERIRAAHHRVTELAEKSLAHALAGNPAAAVEALIAHGEKTRNAKLLDMARSTLTRHRARIDQAGQLETTVDNLRRRWSPSAASTPIVMDQGRSAGGLRLSGGAQPTSKAASTPAAPTSTVPS